MADWEDYCWLTSDDAETWLRKVAAQLRGRSPTPSSVRALRTSLGAARTALVLEQVELRARAKAKFSHADVMLFTRHGLEQATDEVLATYKAARFAELGAVADLCCGIGGDAIALAADHPLTLVDRDEIALLLATTNVRRITASTARGLAAGVSPQHIQDAAGWHIDPDRRSAGRRVSRVELADPGIDMLERLIAACADGAIKLAPAADVPEDWRPQCEREWIETRGECRQQVAWLGRLAGQPDHRTATLVDDLGEACSFAGRLATPPEFGGQVGRYLYDPSPSLVAAGLVACLADALGLSAVSRQSPYLTSNELVVHPHLQAFAVEEVLPLDVRQLRAYLKECRIGRLEIKKRGVDVAPERLRTELSLAGDDWATLILAQVDDRTKAILCRRAS